MDYVRTPVMKACSRCKVVTEFPNGMGRTCKPCQALNRKDAQDRTNERIKRERENRRNCGLPQEPAKTLPKRATKVEPDLATDMCRGALSRFYQVLDIGPSGPVRSIRPGDPEFAGLASMYGDPR